MRQKTNSRKSKTDWARLKTVRDKNIDLSENPEIPPQIFARAIVRHGLKPVSRKSQLTLRLDDDVLAWFKAQGHGYQTRINSLLRAYMEAHANRHA